MGKKDVALVTEARYERPPPDRLTRYVQNILDEDALVGAGLARHGLSSTRVDWARQDFEWGSVRGALFRTTWDYFDRLAEFSAWLDRVSTCTRLINPIELVRWNLDKHYLADLSARGARTVPTHFVEAHTPTSLAGQLESLGWHDAVLKPAVSGAGRHTYRVALARAAEHESTFAKLVAAEAVLLQPFQREIVRSGELTLVVVGGECTHAVGKRAKVGDFRVQDDHGGTVHPHSPSVEERELALRVVGMCDPTPAYARVDLVRDNEGALAVMELELVEPELFLRFHPPAAKVLADDVARRLTTPNVAAG